jgi:hypothetical protein
LQKRLNRDFIDEKRQRDAEPVQSELRKLITEIKQILDARKKSLKPKRSIRSNSPIKDLKRLPNKKETVKEILPDSFNDIIDSLGVDASEEIRMIIRLIDEQYIQPTSESKEQYQQKLLELKQQIEELLEE